MSEIQEVAQLAFAERAGLLSDIKRGPKQLAAASRTSEDVIRSLAVALADSQIVIWQPDLYQLATSGYGVFQGLDAMSASRVYEPHAPQFWHFHKFDLLCPPEYSPPTGYGAIQMLFVPRGYKGIAAFPIVIYVLYKEGEKVALRVTGVQTNTLPGNAAEVYAALAFMDLKLAALDPAPLPRAERRRLARQQSSLPDIRIVQLRQRESSGGQEAGGRKYHHKWLVQGHWRRLHEPRKADGAEVTFVHAYVKGPESAPLLQPRESVYVVAR